MPNRRTFPVATAAGLSALIAFAASAARADLKVVSETTVTGLEGLPASSAAGLDPKTAKEAATKPIVSTVYYKGERVRQEAQGSVVIRRADRTTVVLDPVAKTYSVQPATDLTSVVAPAASPLGGFKLDGVVKVDKADGEKRSVAGRPARRYRYAGDLKMSLGGGGEGSAPGITIMTLGVSGEEWKSENVSLPAGGKRFASTLGLLALPAFGPLFGGEAGKAFAQLDALEGLSLGRVFTLKFQLPKDSPFADVLGAYLPKQPLSLRTQVVSVSEEPLADELFLVPSDYKLVDPPAAPTLPPVASPK